MDIWNLSLPEKLFLLSVNPVKGGFFIQVGSKFHYVMAGAMLFEMSKSGNIKIEKKRIRVLSSNTKNEAMRLALYRLARSKKPKKASDWISTIRKPVLYYKESIKRELSNRGIIIRKKKRFLFFTWEHIQIVRKGVIHELHSEIDGLIFKNVDTNEDDLMLLSFIQILNILRMIYPKKEQYKDAKKRIKNLHSKNQIPEIVQETIKSINAAIAASISASAAASAST